MGGGEERGDEAGAGHLIRARRRRVRRAAPGGNAAAGRRDFADADAGSLPRRHRLLAGPLALPTADCRLPCPSLSNS